MLTCSGILQLSDLEIFLSVEEVCSRKTARGAEEKVGGRAHRA